MDMKPIKEPYKPSLGEILTKVKRTAIQIPDEKWAPYLGWPPHLVKVQKPAQDIDSEF